MPFPLSWWGTYFSQHLVWAWSWSTEAVGNRSRHTDRCPRLTSDHRCHCCMPPHRHQDWDHQICSHVAFAQEFRVCLHPSEKNSSQYSWWRVTQDSSANIRWDQCWWIKSRSLCANIQQWLWLSRASLWYLSGCPGRYRGASIPCWMVQKKHPGCLISSTLTLNAERNRFPFMIQRRTWSPFDGVVFHRCQPNPSVRLLVSRIWHGVFDVTLRHSNNSSHFPLRMPSTSEPNNIFYNNYWPGIDCYDCLFVFKRWFAYSSSS